MHRIDHRGAAAFVFAVIMTTACARPAAGPDADLIKQARDAFGTLPRVMASPENPATPAMVALGRALFYESRVSADGTVSCSRCHPFGLYGADGLPRSIGNRGRTSPRNAPTVLNAAGQIAAHWIGNRTGVEDQARQALVGPASFGMPTYEAAESRLRGVPGYLPLFQKAFPDDPEPVTAAHFALAVGAFERVLTTPGPLDDFLAGRGAALDDMQKAGLKEFLGAGCAACHTGPYAGGQSYQKFGIKAPYWKHTLSPEIDPGRFEVTKNEADRYVFKVPVLRNVQMTPPYFHDGSVGRLPDAVWVMAKVQLGEDLAEGRVRAIVRFLEALTGPLPSIALEVPVLPASETSAAADPPDPPEGLSPNEDLMQEHALLSRVLLIYEEVGRRLESEDTPDPDILARAAGMVRTFVEDYHEMDEEASVFPRFAKTGPLGALVEVLLEQHRAGRTLTGRIIAGSTAETFRDPTERRKLFADLHAFIRMYRPHAAREGSVLFPAFRKLLPPAEFLKLGNAFEDREHEVLGAAGFEGQVGRVAALEMRLGIGDLARYTPAARDR